MKLGFSSLSLFMNSFYDILDIATNDGFKCVEILAEGPYLPRVLLQSDELEVFDSFDLDIYIHAPTVDLNPASINCGIRLETEKQIFETIDLANKINAKAITIHPGIVHRREDRIRDMAIKYSIESLYKCSKYAKNMNVTLSLENMPNKFSFLGSSLEEYKFLLEGSNCSSTIDLGHANTNDNTEKFLEIKNINYFHLNDNDSFKDQHLSLGEGTLNLDLLKKVNIGIIELNNYQNVLKSKKLIERLV